MYPYCAHINEAGYDNRWPGSGWQGGSFRLLRSNGQCPGAWNMEQEPLSPVSRPTDPAMPSNDVVRTQTRGEEHRVVYCVVL